MISLLHYPKSLSLSLPLPLDFLCVEHCEDPTTTTNPEWFLVVLCYIWCTGSCHVLASPGLFKIQIHIPYSLENETLDVNLGFLPDPQKVLRNELALGRHLDTGWQETKKSMCTFPEMEPAPPQDQLHDTKNLQDFRLLPNHAKPHSRS